MLAMYLSILIKALVLLMAVAVFLLMRKERAPPLGPLTHLYLMKRKYEFLRISLLAVAALLLFEIFDSIAGILRPDLQAFGLNILLSDLVAVFLALVLVRLYRIIRSTPS